MSSQSFSDCEEQRLADNSERFHQHPSHLGLLSPEIEPRFRTLARSRVSNSRARHRCGRDRCGCARRCRLCRRPNRQ